MQHFNKWFTWTLRKPSIWLISCENVQNLWTTGRAYHCPSIHSSPYIRLFESSWPTLYIFRALMNMGRNKKTGREGGRKGNSHLAFTTGTDIPSTLWMAPKQAMWLLRDPEMNSNSCFPHQASITNTPPFTGRCSIKNYTGIQEIVLLGNQRRGVSFCFSVRVRLVESYLFQLFFFWCFPKHP